MNLFSTKTWLIACSLLVASQALIAQPKPTRRTTKTANFPNVPLENNGDTYFYYNQNGHLYQTQYDIWLDTQWAHYTYDTYTLDAQGRPLEILQRSNATNTNQTRRTFEYHPDGQTTVDVMENWNSSTQSWDLVTSNLTEYSPTNKPYITQNSQNSGGTLYVSKTTYAFDAQDRFASAVSESFNNGAWGNSLLQTFHYTGNSTVYDTLNRAYWNTGSWGPTLYRNVQTVNGSERIELTQQADGNGGFAPQNKVIRVDGFGEYFMLFEIQNWNSTANGFITNLKFEHDFNADNSVKQFRYSRPDFGSPDQTLFLAQVSDFGYDTYLSGGEAALPVEVKVSPNPTADFVNIEAENDAPMSIRLTDMNGRLVQQMRSAGKNATVSLFGQEAGAYFLQIEQAGAVKTLPVMKF